MSLEKEGEQPVTKSGSKPKDPVFKNLMQACFEQEHLTDAFAVIPGLQVGQLQLEIDVAVVANETVSDLLELQTGLARTPFSFFSRYNLVEFKSISDPLDEADFARIHARASLAWADLPKSRRAGLLSCIVSAAYPRDFLKEGRWSGKRFKELKPGVYYHPGFMFPIYLISCNRLPLEEANFALLLFSSGQKLDEYMKIVFSDTKYEMYSNYVSRLHPQKALQILSRRQKMTAREEELAGQILSRFSEEGLAKFIERVGFERAIELIGPEKFIETFGSEHTIELIGPEKFIETFGSEHTIELIGPEKFIETFGSEHTIELIGPEKFIETFGSEHTIELIGPEKFIAIFGVESLASKLSAEQREQLRRILEDN